MRPTRTLYLQDKNWTFSSTLAFERLQYSRLKVTQTHFHLYFSTEEGCSKQWLHLWLSRQSWKWSRWRRMEPFVIWRLTFPCLASLIRVPQSSLLILILHQSSQYSEELLPNAFSMFKALTSTFILNGHVNKLCLHMKWECLYAKIFMRPGCWIIGNKTLGIIYSWQYRW